jgi:Protein of unknown function (DUF2510)
MWVSIRARVSLRDGLRPAMSCPASPVRLLAVRCGNGAACGPHWRQVSSTHTLRRCAYTARSTAAQTSFRTLVASASSALDENRRSPPGGHREPCMSTITGQIHSRFPEGEVVTSGSPAPGWYPDPLGAPQQRFFDGTHWTDHYAPQIAAHEIAPPLVRPLEPLPDKVATPPAPMWSAASEPVPGPSTSFLPEAEPALLRSRRAVGDTHGVLRPRLRLWQPVRSCWYRGHLVLHVDLGVVEAVRPLQVRF